MITGRTIAWSIPESFRTEATTIKELGLKPPKNMHKTALKKAVDVVKKRNMDKVKMSDAGRARRGSFKPAEDKRGYAIVVPYLDEDGNYATKNALSVKVNIKTGSLEFVDHGTVPPKEYERLKNEVLDGYQIEKNTIDAGQFRAALTDYLIIKCHAIRLRSTGGIYFVSRDFEDRCERLREIFAHFPETKLISMITHDDADSLNAIEITTDEAFEQRIKVFQDKLQSLIDKGQLTTKNYRTKFSTKHEKLLQELELHKGNLRGKYEDAKKRYDDLRMVLDARMASAKDLAIPAFDLAEALAAMNDEDESIELARRLSAEVGEDDE